MPGKFRSQKIESPTIKRISYKRYLSSSEILKFGKGEEKKRVLKKQNIHLSGNQTENLTLDNEFLNRTNIW